MVLDQYIDFPNLNRSFYLQKKKQKTITKIGQQIVSFNVNGVEIAKNARKLPKERQRGKV